MSGAPAVRIAFPSDAAGMARVHVESWRATYRGLMPGALRGEPGRGRRSGREMVGIAMSGPLADTGADRRTGSRGSTTASASSTWSACRDHRFRFVVDRSGSRSTRSVNRNGQTAQQTGHPARAPRPQTGSPSPSGRRCGRHRDVRAAAGAGAGAGADAGAGRDVDLHVLSLPEDHHAGAQPFSRKRGLVPDGTERVDGGVRELRMVRAPGPPVPIRV